MATNFPGSLDSYTTKSSGDTIAEGHVNDPQDAIEAIEAKMGIDASTPTDGKVLAGTGVGTSEWVDVTSELNTYDSGWFGVATATTYTKTHSLGTTAVIAKLWFSDQSDGSSNVFEVFIDTPSDIGGQLYDLTTTDVKVFTEGSTVARKITAGGGGTNYSSGYYRIVILALA